MKNYIQSGDVVTVPAPAAVVSGQGVLVGTLFGVANYNAASGAEVEITCKGVFDLPKAPSQAWTVGQLIYWDAANARTTNVLTGNTLIGKAVLAVAGGAGDVIGRVRLG